MADATFLQADLRERPETDLRLEPWLMLFIVAPTLAAGLFAGGFVILRLVPPQGRGLSVLPVILFVAMSALVAVVGWAGSVYLTYQLVNRRDRHFRRVARLAEDATAYLQARGAEAGVDVSEAVSRVEGVQREMRQQAGERGAAIWTILCVLAGGIVYCVLWYVLMEDYRQHEANETALASGLSEGFAALGVETSIAFRPTIPDRRFWWYLVYTVITFGIFWIYWFYVMMADPNAHFDAHAHWEARLAPVAQ